MIRLLSLSASKPADALFTELRDVLSVQEDVDNSRVGLFSPLTFEQLIRVTHISSPSGSPNTSLSVSSLLHSTHIFNPRKFGRPNFRELVSYTLTHFDADF